MMNPYKEEAPRKIASKKNYEYQHKTHGFTHKNPGANYFITLPTKSVHLTNHMRVKTQRLTRKANLKKLQKAIEKENANVKG